MAIIHDLLDAMARERDQRYVETQYAQAPFVQAPSVGAVDIGQQIYRQMNPSYTPPLPRPSKRDDNPPPAHAGYRYYDPAVNKFTNDYREGVLDLDKKLAPGDPFTLREAFGGGYITGSK